MAPNGVNLPVGLDLTDVQKELSVLTSSLTDLQKRYEGALAFEPIVKTSKFTSALEDIGSQFNILREKLAKPFEFKINRMSTGLDGKASMETKTESVSFDRVAKSAESARGVIKDLRASLAQFGSDENGQLNETGKALMALIQSIELMLKRYKDVDTELIRNKERIYEQVKAEEQLRQKQRERLATLQKMQKPVESLKTTKDFNEWLRTAEKISKEARSWGTAYGNLIANRNDKKIAEVQGMLDRKIKQEAEEKRILGLAEQQEELLRRQNAESDRTLEGLRKRYNYSKQILDVQRQLNGTPFYDPALIAKQQAMQDPKLTAFWRRNDRFDRAYREAEGADDLQGMLAARRNSLREYSNLELSRGEKYTRTDELKSEISALERRLQLRKEDKKAYEGLASAMSRINKLERDRAAASGRSTRMSQLQAEERAVNGLIEAWEKYAEKARGYGRTNEQSNALKQADAYRKQLNDINALKEEERARIRSNNQNNALLSDQAKLVNKLRTLAGHYINVWSVINVGKKIMETTGYFEQQRVALEGILGSASEATKAIERIKSMALQSPFETKDLVGYTKQLAAYGIESSTLLDTVKQLGDLSAGLGVDMGRLILAFGQVKSASVLRGQELRQFTEAGVPMVEELAKRFTELNGKLVTTGQVFDLISKRQVPFEMVAGVLRDMTSEGGKFYNMQEKVTDTLYGQMQKLKDLWTLAMNDTGSSLGGTLKAFVKALQLIVKGSVGILGGAAMAGALKGLMLMQGSLRSINRSILHSTWSVRNLLRSILAVKTTTERLKIAWAGLKSVMTPNFVIAALSTITALIMNATRNARELRNALSEIEDSFSKDRASKLNGLDNLIYRLRNATAGTKEYNEALDTLKNNYGDYVNENIIKQLIAEAKSADIAAESWGRVSDAIRAAIEGKMQYDEYVAKRDRASETMLTDVLDDVNELHKFISVGVRDELDRAAKEAINMYIQNNGTSVNDFESAVDRIFADDAIKDILKRSASAYMNLLEHADGYREYEKNANKIKETPYYRINQGWSTAKDDFYRTFIPTTKNPFEEQHAFADAMSKTFLQLAGKELGVRKNDDGNWVMRADTKELISQDPKKWNSYVRALQDLDKWVNADYSAEKTYQVADAFHRLTEAVDDPRLKSRLNTLADQFSKDVSTTTGVSSVINDRINNKLSIKALAADRRKLYADYAVTDQNIEEQTQKLINERKSEAQWLKTYSRYNTAGASNEEREEYLSHKNTKETLDDIFTNIYRLKDDDKKSGSGSNVLQVPMELQEFVNNYKNAYELYKQVTQSQGVNMGIGYMQNNEQMQRRFDALFHNGNGNMFNITDENGNITTVNGKPIGEILQESFINSGLEEGIIDFEKGARAIARELHKYAEADKKNRRQFEQQAKAMEQWADNIAKDNVSAFLTETNRQFSELAKTMQYTTKQTEIYQRLLQNGTDKLLGRFVGSTREMALTPNSVREMDNIQQYVSLYNELLRNVYKENLDDAMLMSISDFRSTGDIAKTITDVLSAVQRLNNDNFAVDGQYGEAGKQLVSMLEKYLDVIAGELGDISGEVFTGNAMNDLVVNANNAMEIARAEMERKANTQNLYESDNGAISHALAEKATDNAMKIIEQFLKDNDIEASAMSGSLFGLRPEAFSELEKKFNAIVDKVDDNMLKDELARKFRQVALKYQESVSKMAMFGTIRQNINNYRNADVTAQQDWQNLVDKRNELEDRMVHGELMGDYNENELAAMRAELELMNAELEKMGENGKYYAAEMKKAALENIQENIKQKKEDLDSMVSSVTALSGAVKAFWSTYSTFYDEFNDGENPEWMKEMDDFLSDFDNAFQQLIAPMSAVISLVSTLAVVAVTAEAAFTPLLIVTAVFVAAAAAVAGIVAAFQAHDKKLQRTIEDIQKDIDEFEASIKSLNSEAERQVGLEKLKTRVDAIGKSLSIYYEKTKQARAEDAKWNTDIEELAKLQREADEALNEFLNSIKDVNEELHKSVEDWSSAIADPIRSAFQNGENAARAFRDNVKTMIGDVVQEMLKMTIVEPLMKSAMQKWTNSDYLMQKYTSIVKDDEGKDREVFDEEGYLKDILENIMDSDRAQQFYQAMLSIGTTFEDAKNSLPTFLRDAWAYNSELSSLTGGIEQETEDTARRIEALQNASFGELFQIRTLLENYILGSGDYASSTMATIQSALSSMAADTNAINIATNAILREIRQMRTTRVNPLNVRIV